MPIGIISVSEEGSERAFLYLYVTCQYALLCYRATGVTLARHVIVHDIIHGLT